MDKLQTRVVTDTRNVFLSLATMYGSTSDLVKSFEDGSAKDQVVSAAFVAFDITKMWARCARMGISLTHLRAFARNAEQYYEWQLEGIAQAQPRMDMALSNLVGG